MSVLRDIADALAEGLAAEEFTGTPSVTRANWPTYDVEAMTDPVIVVVPGGVESTRVDRSHWQYDYAINVFVGRHAPTEQIADDTLTLAEDVLDAIRDHAMTATFPSGVTSPMTCEIEINPDEALQERNVWRAVITATYRVFR